MRWLLERFIPCPRSAMAERLRKRVRHTRYLMTSGYSLGVLILLSIELPFGLFLGLVVMPFLHVFWIICTYYFFAGLVRGLRWCREPGAMSLLLLALVGVPLSCALVRLPREIWVTATPWRSWYYFDDAREAELTELSSRALAIQRANPEVPLPADLHEQVRAAGFTQIRVDPGGAYISLEVRKMRSSCSYVFAPDADVFVVGEFRGGRRLSDHWSTFGAC